MDAVKVLTDQLEKPPEQSKKYGMTKFAVYVILGVFAVSSVLFMIKPDTAGQIVILAQIVTGAVAGLVGIYLGAQGSVEFKTATSLAAVVESTRNEVVERIEHVITEGDPDAPPLKPWGMAAREEEV